MTDRVLARGSGKNVLGILHMLVSQASPALPPEYTTVMRACSYWASLIHRRSGGGAKENAWYTLFAHALNFREISENRILQ